MSIKYFPFDSTFTGVDADGIPQGDRGATSADWAAYVSRMFTNGYFRLLDDQLTPSVSATPMAVDIASGAAMIKGRQYSQDAPVTVSLGLSSSQPRIDRIVLRMSTEAVDRKISLVVIKGTPASSPTAPALTRTASVYDICLAQISVGANAIQIVAANLTDTRSDEALCGYVKILLDGRYYPDTTIPALLWVYTIYPNTLTTGQKAVIEGDTGLMGVYNASRIADIGNHFTLFTANGNFTAPATGLYKVTVLGGGGGAEGIYAAGDTYMDSGSGGGGGGYAIKWVSLAKNAVVAVTVGAGGAGGTGATSGTPSKPGVNGGTSSFGAHCSATGGAGGSGSGEAAAGVGVGGDINVTGGVGPTASYNVQSGSKITAGDSFLGKATPSLYNVAGVDGVNASELGCGGTGPMVKGYTTPSRPGGNGFRGVVIVEYVKGA